MSEAISKDAASPVDRLARSKHSGDGLVGLGATRIRTMLASRALRFRQSATGSLTAVAAVVALSAVMFPLREHLSVATSALVLIVPVVIGVMTGGFVAGTVAIAVGFLAYDFIFIPPYYTLSVGSADNWVAIGVYVVVMLLLAQVVTRLNDARSEARQRATESKRLLDVSELLVRESSMSALLDTIVVAVRQAFDLDGAALLLPRGEQLELAASSGTALSEFELRRLSKRGVVPVSLETGSVPEGGIRAVALVASGRAVGLLVLRGLQGTSRDRDLLRTLANHLALALERAELQEQAVRNRLLEEIDRLRRALVGAVSHDLRTPLATIKVATSTLIDPEAPVAPTEAAKLVRLIDVQADRLNRMVSNVLDMTRIQSGTLELRRVAVSVRSLVEEAFSILGSLAELDRVDAECLDNLPLVEVDRVLICQVLANLIDNATRYAPGNSPVTISARSSSGRVEVAVTDGGPGVPKEERMSIFQMFNRREAGGRGGLGLAIAQAFVEAHGERIWVDECGGPGARFVFTLPAAVPSPAS